MEDTTINSMRYGKIEVYSNHPDKFCIKQDNFENKYASHLIRMTKDEAEELHYILDKMLFR